MIITTKRDLHVEKKEEIWEAALLALVERGKSSLDYVLS